MMSLLQHQKLNTSMEEKNDKPYFSNNFLHCKLLREWKEKPQSGEKYLQKTYRILLKLKNKNKPDFKNKLKNLTVTSPKKI
jgi:hypothetical protein